MQLDGLLYVYILFRRRNIDFFVRYYAWKRNLMLTRLAGLALWTRLHGKFSARLPGIPVSIPGSRLTGLAWLLCNCEIDFCCVLQTCRDLGNPSQPGSCNQALNLAPEMYITKETKWHPKCHCHGNSLGSSLFLSNK